MNYGEALSYIHSLGKFSLPAGLDRITKLLESIGNPQKDFPAIHIAGTNGKGSVAVMLAEIFKEAGFKTGLYISPFIVSFNERIQIDGEYISDEDLVSLCEYVKGQNTALTEFEFITAMAFSYFAEKKCDIVIAETGLGGRLDATNTLLDKRCAVITKIGLDHCGLLGDTIEQIAAEKCGIIRKAKTVSSPSQQENAMLVIKEKAQELYVPDLSALQILKSDDFGNAFIYKGRQYETSLIGAHQIENALCAIEAVLCSGFDIPYNIISKGIKNAFIPARLERIANKNIFIDGAHNPDAADRLYEFLKGVKGDICAIIGMMKDKDCEYVLSRVLPICKNAIAVKCCEQERAMPQEQLCKIAQKYCPCIAAESIDEAVALAVTGQKTVVAFGSLYLASAVREKLKNK